MTVESPPPNMRTAIAPFEQPGATPASGRFRGVKRLAAVPGLFQFAFALPYLALLVWFHGVDVYHHHFSEHGAIVVVYNCFRVLFCFYLFWIVATTGLLLARAVARQSLAKINTLERLALCFFAGTGLWHAALLALGYLGLYVVPIAIAITLPFVILSYTPGRAVADELYRAVAAAGESRRDGVRWFLVSCAGGAYLLLLLIKGLYPGGGHDYFTHYFYYLQATIAHGGLWPNDVWYHYYYEKGAGLFFLGILLTDPLAPQLVTFTFMTAAVLPLYLLLRRIAPGTLWPLVGIALFLSLYIFTPGPDLYSSNGGWANFEKLHEINAALIIAIVWMSVELLSVEGRLRGLWVAGISSAIVCAVIVDITIAIYLGGLFALLACFCVASRRMSSALICIGLAAVAGLLLIAILILNQATTGLADDQGILLFWNFANIEKLSQQGTLLYVMMLYHDFQAMVAAHLLLSFRNMFSFFADSLRLDLVTAMALGGLFIAALATVFRSLNRQIVVPAMTLGAAVLVLLALAVTVGRAQQISFYRYSSFATAIVIACGVLGWSSARDESPIARFCRFRATAIIIMFLCLIGDAHPGLAFNTLANTLQFATGRYSIDAAYSNQYGPAPRKEWSAIHSGARGAYEVVGPGTPIWSFHINTYCMLPDCLVESYPSFLMTHHWDQVMFGTPEEAKQILHVAHLDYFLFSREADIRDPLPLSPLFSPSTIGRYLGIRWTDGKTSLLTWLGPGVVPLDQAWLANYRVAVNASGAVGGFPYEAVKGVFTRLTATPHPWRSFQLPWQEGSAF
jgi:hypothetical protein